MAMTKFDLYQENGNWVAVNCETGEVVPFSTPKSTTTTRKKKAVEDTDPVAKITLVENKYQFNTAAVELMGITPDDRIDIKYEKRKGEVDQPVIGTDDVFGTQQGNRLTKSYTVSYKGKNRERLEQFGTVFTITPHPEKDGLFLLNGDKKLEMPVMGNDDIKSPDEIEDINLSDFADETTDSNEIDLNDFSLENYGI